MKKIALLLIAATFLLASPLTAFAVNKMTKEELKDRLGQENLVILDVRSGRDWSSSEFMIQDAIRVDGKDLSVAENYPKDNIFVLYCA